VPSISSLRTAQTRHNADNVNPMRMKTLLALISIIAVASVTGCSTNENPITPDKMNEIRKQEGEQRANFKPDENAVKGVTK